MCHLPVCLRRYRRVPSLKNAAILPAVSMCLVYSATHISMVVIPVSAINIIDADTDHTATTNATPCGLAFSP